MQNALEQSSTVTAKGQTTIPKAVRQALGLKRGERITFHVSADGVKLSRAESDDPAIDAFLEFLSHDMQANPENIEALSPVLAKRIAELTAGIPVDLNDVIDGDVAL